MLTIARDALNVIAEAITLLGPYWGWCAVCLTLAFFGEALKRFFTPQRVARSKLARAWDNTKMFHPPIAGALLGAIPGMPLPASVQGLVARIVYFAVAGVCSTWVYHVGRWVYRRWGNA